MGANPHRPPADGEFEWYSSNRESILRADALIGTRLADSKWFCAPTALSLCDEVFTVMKQSLTNGDNGSLLLLGESGSGKTHIVEWCIRRLREAQSSLAVLRAHGGSYTTDLECIRHLATQATGQVAALPRMGASYEQSLACVRSVLLEGFSRAGAVLVVLERFEHFCSRSRQTLLYNLFDMAQEVGVKLCIVGTSEKMDVLDALEKRIKSRFSMRRLHSYLPSTMEDLVQILMAKLRLPADSSLKAPFLKEFHRHLEAALQAKAPQWTLQLELGRSPAWFLGQCLPLSTLLLPRRRAAAGAPATVESAPGGITPPPAKRARFSAPAAGVDARSQVDLLSSLPEAEQAVLLALHRGAATLGAALHELHLLHGTGGLVAIWSEDSYCAAFDRLLQAGLVELLSAGARDVPRLHAPCRSLVEHIYDELVRDLERSDARAPLANPLRALPQPVQQWAVRGQSRG